MKYIRQIQVGGGGGLWKLYKVNTVEESETNCQTISKSKTLIEILERLSTLHFFMIACKAPCFEENVGRIIDGTWIGT